LDGLRLEAAFPPELAQEENSNEENPPAKSMSGKRIFFRKFRFIFEKSLEFEG
jgi:hypothetical protein